MVKSEQTNENTIELKSISQLLGMIFFIPSYQRGYRWGKVEVEYLLDDIFEYQQTASDRCNKVSKFYCLQPVVVKEKVNAKNKEVSGWEVIDGQQRLTTIFLILSYLKDLRQFHDQKDVIFNLKYETREKCEDFFEQQKFLTIDKTNIDFFHISSAYNIICEWFKDKSTSKLDILKTILNEEYNVSVIWYVAPNDTKSIDLFTRLNDGKIPLTDAELVKALLLQQDKYVDDKEKKYIKQRLFEIATEWDEIESILNEDDDKFWLFYNNVDFKPKSRIEFVFNILAEKWDKNFDREQKNDAFLVFENYLKDKIKEFKAVPANKDVLYPINEVWAEIKTLFSTLSEWYNNHTLYHYIGYLLAIADDTSKLITELLKLELDKSEFINEIKVRIKKKILITKKKDGNSNDVKVLSDLSYSEDNNEIISILLLFNVETVIQQKKENARFPFHLYKKDKISSIEHIHPQNPEDIDTDKDRCEIWLKNHYKTLEKLSLSVDMGTKKTELLEKIKTQQSNFNKEEFKAIFTETIELHTKNSDIEENELHTLYNLALVDKDTNSALNNSFFDIKREILKENKNGRYIPICTQRVFSKYYSKSPQEMIFWNNDDRKAYFEKIEEVYNSFINLK